MKRQLADQFRRNTAISLIVCFLVLLWLPTLDRLFHLDRAPMQNENRALASFPSLRLSRQGAHDYPAGLEAYFRDHFGFRNQLLRWASRWRRDLFKESNTSEVLKGEKGWLYYAGNQMLENFQGLRQFTTLELEAWQALLERRRAWLAQRGIKYLFVVAPDKQSIYPEYLPAWLADRNAATQLDQFLDYMKAHSDVAVLDLRAALRAAKRSRPVYLQTDTHWNSFGAFIGYQTLVKALQLQLPGLGAPLPLSAFDVHPVQSEAGDLARMLGPENQLVESNALALVPIPPLGALKLESKPDRLSTGPALAGTELQVSIYEGANAKAILFRDSFATAWRPFLGYSFHDVLYVWQNQWDAALIEREQPQVVIDEMVERFLGIRNAAELMKKDALP